MVFLSIEISDPTEVHAIHVTMQYLGLCLESDYPTGSCLDILPNRTALEAHVSLKSRAASLPDNLYGLESPFHPLKQLISLTPRLS